MKNGLRLSKTTEKISLYSILIYNGVVLSSFFVERIQPELLSIVYVILSDEKSADVEVTRV